jgi:hypothetical protein
MAMRTLKLWLTAILVLATGTGLATAAEADALAVVQALLQAEGRADLEAAMALFAEGAVITNATGWKITTREQLRWFINSEIWLRDSFALEDIEARGNRVTWSEPATGSFYQSLGIAPVRFAFEAKSERGRIISIVAHVSAPDIKRIAGACKDEAAPQIHDRPCTEFVKLLEAHTNDVGGLSSRELDRRPAHH